MNEQAQTPWQENPMSPGPEGTAERESAWQWATDRLMVWLILSCVSIELLGLNYILPTLGLIFAVRGFGALRRENRWLGRCYVLAVVRLVWQGASLALNTTPLPQALWPRGVWTALSLAGVALQLAEFYSLWMGLAEVRTKAGVPPPKPDGALGVLGWYTMSGAAALWGGGVNGILAVVWLAVLGYVVWSLFRNFREVDRSGFVLDPAPMQCSGGKIAALLLAVLVPVSALSYGFAGRYPMDWTPLDPAEQADVQETRAHLNALGFPAEVLDDLTPEDIAACAGARQVVKQVHQQVVDDYNPASPSALQMAGTGERQSNTLQVYGIAVELAGDKGEWKIFHHFRWALGTGFVGTDALQLLPAYQDSRSWTAVTGDAAGRLLCEQKGQTVTAPYFYLGSRGEVYETSIWGSRLGSAIYAAFSLPADGTGCRGYLTYRVYLAQEDGLLTSRLNYVHQLHRLQYPAVTAMEYRQNGGWGRSGAFEVVQTALQCYGDGLVVQ